MAGTHADLLQGVYLTLKLSINRFVTRLRRTVGLVISIGARKMRVELPQFYVVLRILLLIGKYPLMFIIVFPSCGIAS